MSSAAQMIAQIDGATMASFRLCVREQRPVRTRSGWLEVKIALCDASRASVSPLLVGIVSGGGRGVAPWIECRIIPTVEFADGAIDIRELGLEERLIAHLGHLIPPGGHLMVDYESAGQELTMRELALRVPPSATHLGSLMFYAGLRGKFKDWYFSEGGNEGPRKLQANKSPNQAAARSAMREQVALWRDFIRGATRLEGQDGAILRAAIARARALVAQFGPRSAIAGSKARPER